MNEIKFRGKRIDGKGWVYGYLVRKVYGVVPRNGDTESEYAIINGMGGNITACNECGEPDFDIYDVIPETIGQYTGRHDNENDKELYAGDILDFVVFDYTGGDTAYKGIITWNNEDSAFMIKTKHEDEMFLGLVLSQDDDAEKIGNIYDNPELLNKE